MPDRFTISGSSFGTASFTDPSIWYGGIVPTASDNVFIRGVRTTLLSQNQGAPGPGNPGFPLNNEGLMFWPGTQSFLRVNSTAGFPPTGSFFTYTDRDVEVKIDYDGISGSFYFVNCRVDKTYSSPWGSGSNWMTNPELPSKVGGVIPTGSYIQFRPGLIVLSGSLTASAFQTTIENGGKFELRNSSSYYFQNYIATQDGFLTAKDDVTFYFNPTYTSSFATSSANVYVSASYFFVNWSQPFCQVSLEGRELRTNTTLSLSASIGDGFLSVNNASNFETGDWIFVGEENLVTTRVDDGSRFYQGVVPSDDECFYVATKDTGSSPHRLFIQRMNGLQGKVFATASSTEIIVDEERYNVGDKVVINGQLRTITEVTSSYDYLLKDYNFQSGSTLDDWEFTPTRSPLHNGWALAPGFGLTNQHNSIGGNYRQTVIKDVFRDNIKIEAWISNYMQITASTTDSGSRSSNQLGIFIHSEPLADIGENIIQGQIFNQTQQFTRTYLVVNPLNRTGYLGTRGYADYSSNSQLSQVGITNTEGLLKYTIECSQGFTRGYINDILIQETMLRSGWYAGRVGVFTQNPKFICTRFIVYAKCQKIKLDSPITEVKANDVVYESGLEYPHNPGDQVIKLASKITNALGHTNLAFAYRGFPEYQNDGALPYIYSYGTDGTVKLVPNNAPSLYASLLHNNVQNEFLLTAGAKSGSFTLDFTTPTTFNNVAVVERFRTQLQNFSSSLNNGTTISGSNDTFTWFPLTSSIDVRGRIATDTLRDYQLTSSVTYRYVRIEFQGLTNSATVGENSFYTLSVRNLLTSSIQLNNTSDLNVGDRINIVPKSSVGPYGTLANFADRLFVSGSSSLLDNYRDFYTIVGKSGNTLTLDRNIQRIIDKDTFVFKANRSINFSGSVVSGSIKTGFITHGVGGSGPAPSPFQYRERFKNIGFQNIDAVFPNPWPSPANPYEGCFNTVYGNVYYPLIIQGCSFYNCFNLANTIPNNNGSNHTFNHIFFRHNNLQSLYSMGPRFQGPNNTYGGQAVPFINTGNLWYNQGGCGLNYTPAFVNVSYNLYQNSSGIAAMTYTYTLSAYTPNGTFLRIQRNFMRYSSYIYSFQQSVSNTDGSELVDIKDNKLEYMIASNAVWGPVMRPVTRTLLSDKQSMDSFRIANPYASYSQAFGSYFGSTFTPLSGMPYHYNKNYNRYNYDFWGNTLGHVIKYPNESWYRHYMFSARNYKDPLYLTQFQVVNDNVSGSFNLSFDYYNDNSQMAFSEYSFTASLQSGLPVNDRQQFAGALYVSVYKDGKEMQYSILPKSSQPVTYNEQFNFTGSGFYFIYVGMSNPLGYTAFRNINGTFNIPTTEDIMIKANTFTMKYFENGVDNLQARNYMTENSLTPKFRLKGARMF
jgi:hypothetical protein